MSGMYEPLRMVSDTYPGVVPKLRVQGLMALVIAMSILWALVWCVSSICNTIRLWLRIC
jgi:hypothetical protein